jgi:predicted DNA-binding protein (MmcQ/YjbR family)
VNIESFRGYCLSKKGVTEDFPFDNNTLVFKVMGKMFALTNVEAFEGVNVKVDPEKGVELRDRYDFIQPAYHMNKKHWVTIVMEGAVPDKLIRELIDDSYGLVVSKLTKSQKLTLNG